MYEEPYVSFSERMQDARDRVRGALHHDDGHRKAEVSWRRPRMRDKQLSVAETAGILGCSSARIRKLIDEGRFVGAKQSRLGRREWVIPTGRDGLPALTPGQRGPKLRHAGLARKHQVPF